MRVLEEIVSAYVFLKDRKALERVRDRRKRLLNEIRSLSHTLQKDIELIDEALVCLEKASAGVQEPSKIASDNVGSS